MPKILYTGLGAKKSGYHTEKEFLDIMNKIFREACIDYHNSKKCKECREYKKRTQKMFRSLFKNTKKSNNSKTIKNNRKKFDDVTRKLKKFKNKCTKCQRKLNRGECNLKEYIEYSGAEISK